MAYEATVCCNEGCQYALLLFRSAEAMILYEVSRQIRVRLGNISRFNWGLAMQLSYVKRQALAGFVWVCLLSTVSACIGNGLERTPGNTGSGVPSPSPAQVAVSAAPPHVAEANRCNPGNLPDLNLSPGECSTDPFEQG